MTMMRTIVAAMRRVRSGESPRFDSIQVVIGPS
jgi:hypothetical protein